MSEFKSYFISILICLLIAAGLLWLMSLGGCTTKYVSYTIPPVIDEQGIVQEPKKVIIYKETNFFSEDTVEGLWFQHDSDGVIVELNKSETTMDAAIKMVEFINTLKPIGL